MMLLLSGAVILALVTAVHEAGHWLAVVAKRGVVRRIQVGRGVPLWHGDVHGTHVTLALLPFGGRIEYEGVRPGTGQMVVAISGSAANLAFSFVSFALALWLGTGEALPNAEGAGGIVSYSAASVAGWFWMIPRTIVELVTAGMAIELNRSLRVGIDLLANGQLGASIYVAAAMSAVWSALNLIPIPILRTDGWMVAKGLWGMFFRHSRS